jgi:hypothetical protein
LLGTCTFSVFSGVDVLLVFNFGTKAANDLARECKTLPFLVNATAEG